MDILGFSLFSWILLLGLVLTLYFYVTRNNSYFSKRNVPFIKPTPFIGTLGPILFRKVSLLDYVTDIYNKFKGHSYGGTFEFMKPIIFIRDPDLIKAITVKDFDYFTDHRSIIKDDIDPMIERVIFNLKGERWRNMRSTLSPAFTSSKMKMMFGLVTECGKQLGAFLEKCFHDYIPEKECKIEKDGDKLVIEMKDLFTRYTNDVIATAAFGVGVDSLTNPRNEFYLLGKNISNFSTIRIFIFFGYILCPSLMKILNINLIPKNVSHFFKSLVCDAMETREREGITRPDLIHLLMQAKKGTLQDEKSLTNVNKILDDNDLAAQAFLFFIAGFDTTATLLCFASYQLARHPDVQIRLQEEIDNTLKENEGILSYETINKMKYLDMVVSETLRFYPPVISVDRNCVKRYILPAEPPIEVNPGDVLGIPIYSIHHDADYFPDPERFDPERFNDENKHNIKPFTYMPFGFGPRTCLGSRFALMESKIAMAYLLSRFSFKVVSRTPIPIKITGLTMTVDGGLWLGLEQRNTKEHAL